MSDTTREELAYERAETEYKRGVRAAIGILAVLCGLCVIASLSGCEGSIGEQCRANGTCIGDKLECRFQYNSIYGRPIYRCMLKDDQKCVAPK